MADLEERRSRGGWALWCVRQLLQLTVAAAALFGATLGADWLVRTKPETERRPVAEKVFAIDTVAVSAGRLRPEIEVFGEVEARRSVALRALVAGEVVDVHPNLVAGDRVPARAELVRIDAFAYAGAVTEARANLAEAEARLAEARASLDSSRSDAARLGEQTALAERDLTRARSLTESGVSNERTLDDRKLVLSQRMQLLEAGRMSVDVQTARVAQQRAVVERLAWRLAEAERALRDTVLRAPFDAVVRSESVEIGRRVGVNDVVAELYEENALDVRFTISNSAFGELLEAERVEGEPLIGRRGALTWRVGAAPVEAPIVVERLGPDVRSERGGVELIARVDIAAASGPTRPGAFVTVRLPGRAYDRAVEAPEAALYDGDHVFVVVDGRLQRRNVELLAWRGDRVVLRGDLDGAAILSSRLGEAGDGVRVRPRGGARAPDGGPALGETAQGAPGGVGG